MRTTKLVLISICVLLIHSPSYAQSKECSFNPRVSRSFGLLMVRSQSPAQSLRLTPMPRDTIILPKGDKHFRFMVNVSSVFASEPGLFTLDFHSSDLHIGYRVGLGKGWDAEFSINERRKVNAHLDQFTLTFHDLFGIDQNGRDQVPKNRTLVSFPTLGINITDKFVVSRAFETTIKKKLVGSNSSSFALAAILMLHIELAEGGGIDNGTVDYSTGLSLRKTISRNTFHGFITRTRFGSDKWFTLPLKRSQWTALFGYERRTAHNQAFLVQDLYSEGVVQNLGELSKPSHEIHVGYKWKLKKTLLEFTIIENYININNSPDIGFTFAFRRHI